MQETQAGAHPPTLGHPPPPTCEEVAAVFSQLLGLCVEATGAAAGGRRQPLAQCLEGRPALGDEEDHDGVVLHIVEALDGGGGHVQERMLVLGQAGRRWGEGDCSRVNRERWKDEESEVRVDPSLSHPQASMLGMGVVTAQVAASWASKPQLESLCLCPGLAAV